MATTPDMGAALFTAILPSADTLLAQRSSLANNNLIAGVKMLQKSRPEDAVAFFKKALAMDSSSIDAYNYLGNTYMQLKKNDKAIETYKKLVAMKPFDVDAKVSLGNAYVQSGKLTDAEMQFKKAVAVEPNHLVANYTLGQVYKQGNKLKEAESQFLKSIRLAPRDGNALYALGATYNKMEQYDKAISTLKKALTLKRDFALAESELGYAYAGKGDDFQVERQIKRLQSLDKSLAQGLKNSTFKPKILNIDYGPNNPFYTQFGPNTTLSLMTLKDPDQTLSQPNATKEFTAVFQFNTDMDPVSIQSVANWKISKATGGKAGYYNHGYTLYPQKEAGLPLLKGITYDVKTQKATLTFSLTQNANADAIIDPSHLVFKFSGKDMQGHKIDPKADEYDGFAGKAF